MRYMMFLTALLTVGGVTGCVSVIESERASSGSLAFLPREDVRMVIERGEESNLFDRRIEVMHVLEGQSFNVTLAAPVAPGCAWRRVGDTNAAVVRFAGQVRAANKDGKPVDVLTFEALTPGTQRLDFCKECPPGVPAGLPMDEHLEVEVREIPEELRDVR
jgi:hypothetical protein